MLKNFNEIITFLSFFACLFSFLLICCIMLIGGFFLGEKKKSNLKQIPFESGIIPVGNTNIRFSVKFYLVAVCFVIFDVETPYLYAWIVNIYSSGFIGLFVSFSFIMNLLISLYYLINMGMLQYLKIKN